ncbi:MAG TPA: hypothetical protein VGA66_13540 [Mycobacterium sp.]
MSATPAAPRWPNRSDEWSLFSLSVVIRVVSVWKPRTRLGTLVDRPWCCARRWSTLVPERISPPAVEAVRQVLL